MITTDPFSIWFFYQLRSAVEYLSEFFILVIVLTIFRISVLLKYASIYWYSLFLRPKYFLKEKMFLVNFCECRSCNHGTLVLLMVNVDRDRGPVLLHIRALSPFTQSGPPNLVGITWELVRNTESQVPLRIHWIRSWILTRPLSDSHAHQSLNVLEPTMLSEPLRYHILFFRMVI